MSQTIRVAVLDDHELVSASVAALLEREVADVQVAWHGVSARELLRVLDAGTHVDVVLLDVLLGDQNPSAADVTSELDARDVATLLVTVLEGGRQVREALLAGAVDCVTKSASPEELAGAIHRVVTGGRMSSHAAQVLMERAAPRLSAREVEVLRLYAQGLPLRAVARRLDITENTCNEYLKRARRKYAEQGRPARTRADLAQRAMEDELLPDDVAAGAARPGR